MLCVCVVRVCGLVACVCIRVYVRAYMFARTDECALLAYISPEPYIVCVCIHAYPPPCPCLPLVPTTTPTKERRRRRRWREDFEDGIFEDEEQGNARQSYVALVLDVYRVIFRVYVVYGLVYWLLLLLLLLLFVV